MPGQARYFGEATAARLLDLSPRTLQRMRAEGGGPAFVRAGARRVLYSAAEIERWVATRTHESRAAELAANNAFGTQRDIGEAAQAVLRIALQPTMATPDERGEADVLTCASGFRRVQSEG